MSDFQKYTPPGVFDLNDPGTAKIADFFDRISEYCQKNSEQYDKFFRLFHTTDYNHVPASSVPYIYELLRFYNLGFFTGDADQAKTLIKLACNPWQESTIVNINSIISSFSVHPFEWALYDSSFQILTGIVRQRRNAVAFIFYANVAYAGNIIYTSPPDFTLPPIANASYFYDNNQTYVNIGWLMGPNQINFSITGSGYVVDPAVFFATKFNYVDNVPANSPSDAGKLYIVKDDSSGDYNSLYFLPTNGTTAARKFSAPYDYQGSPDNDAARAVIAPDNPIPAFPPASGLSKGFGQYSILSEAVIYSNQIIVKVTLTDAGFQNLPAISTFLQKIKPTEKILTLVYTYQDTVFEYEIVDIRQV